MTSIRIPNRPSPRRNLVQYLCNARPFASDIHQHRSTNTSMCRFVIYKGTSPVQLSHVSSRHSSRANHRSFVAIDPPMPLDHKPSFRFSFTPRPSQTHKWRRLRRWCVSARSLQRATFKAPIPGWYDTVHDEELGSQPCIFTSVTPVTTLTDSPWVSSLTPK